MDGQLLVIIPGFGGNDNDIALKRRLISKNLEIIRKTYDGLINVIIFCYDNKGTDVKIKDINIKEIYKPGVIGQFIYNYITPAFIEKYENLIILLDDIELNENTNINKLIEIQNKYNADILSPSLSIDSKYSHSFMLEDKNKKIRDVNFIELFFYFFNKKSFLKWLGLLNEKSAWLWGIDKSLFFNRFKLLLIDAIPMKHHLRGSALNPNLPNPHLEHFDSIRRCTPFKNITTHRQITQLTNKYSYIIKNYLEYN